MISLEFRVAANVDQIESIGYKTKQTVEKRPDYSAWYNIIKPESSMKAKSSTREEENKKSTQNHKPLAVDQSLLFRSVKEKWLPNATVSSWLKSELQTPSKAQPSAAPITKRRLEVPTEFPSYTQTEVPDLPKFIQTKLPIYSTVPCISKPSQTSKLCSIPELPTFSAILSPIQFDVDNVISNQMTSQSAHVATCEEKVYSNLTHSGNALPLEAGCQLTDTQFNCMDPLEVSSYIEVETSNTDNYLDTSSVDINEIQNINAEIEDLVTGRSEFGCTNDVETGNLMIAKGAKASSKVIFDDSGIGIELNSQGQELTFVDSSTPEINSDHSDCPKVSLPQTSFISEQYEGYSMEPINLNYGQLAMTGSVEVDQQSKGKNMDGSSHMDFVQPIGSYEDESMIDNIESMYFDVAESSLDALMQR